MLIFLCVICALTLLLCIPVSVVFRAGDGSAEASVKWLFLRFRLYPQKERPKRAQTEKKKAKKEKPKPEEKKRRLADMDLSELAALAVEAMQSAGRFLRAVLRNVRVRGLVAEVSVAGQDAAQTAVAYGRMQAVLTTALGLLQGYVKIIRPSLSIRPDFLGEKSAYRVRFRAAFTPLIVLGAALRTAVSLLFSFVRHTGRPPTQDGEQQKNTGAPRPGIQKECTANE